MEHSVRRVGELRTPFPRKFGVPRQSGVVDEAWGIVEFDPAFGAAEFVRGLEGFSHVWLLTWFHHNEGWTGSSTVRPPRLGGDARVGVFASRSPNRPNPIGLSLVRLVRVEPGPPARLHVAGVDAVDGTPILDVKPYLPWAEAKPDATGSWACGSPEVRADDAVCIPKECIAKILGRDADGERTLALIRHLLRLDLHPAYQQDEARVYGVSVAGWNVRYRVIAGSAEVVSVAPDTGAPE